jgi:hypothetical protein
MKTDLASLKLGLRPDEAALVIGSEQLFREMLDAGWIKPVLRRHKITLYDRAQLAHAWARILSGEVPSAAPARAMLGQLTTGAES